MKQALANAIYYQSDHNAGTVIVKFIYNNEIEFLDFLKDLKNNLIIRNVFGLENILYDICENIDYKELLLDQSDGLVIITRKDLIIELCNSAPSYGTHGVIKVDAVLFELLQLKTLPKRRNWYLLSLIVLIGGSYFGYKLSKND